MSFYSVALDHLVVVHDELDIPAGTVRVKRGGGEGGHNGLRSISRALGSKDYLRVRVGIGRPPGRMDPADFVLRDFSAAERDELRSPSTLPRTPPSLSSRSVCSPGSSASTPASDPISRVRQPA